jgi:hypothetical protein
MGLDTFSEFLQQYDIKATLFMVGNDFLHKKYQDAIRSIAEEGHEIANHTMTHPQGFRFLSPEQKELEIAGMEQICKELTGRRPVGFRSPGWNISNDSLPVLRKRGYLYDSSIFPTSLMPLLKFLHWKSMRGCKGGNRTTMGLMRYMIAPTTPYRTASNSLSKRGMEEFVEFPVTVIPFVRLPFSATFLLATGLEIFKMLYQTLRGMKCPIQFQFHLSDFVDYSHPDLADQVPGEAEGLYIPRALSTPLSDKIILFKDALNMIARDYQFVTLSNWAGQLIG